MKTTQVAAALIWQGDRFMICRRPANKGNALLWEFVGGKLEPGETHQQALIRECREELGITVEVGDEFCDVYHQYPDIYVHLVVFNAKIAEGTPQLFEHCGLEWITPQEIKNYAFCPAEDYYLKAHLFGDIFARDVLTWAERELATISALASIEGLAPQLGSHVAGSRNMGLKDDEIHAIPAVLAEKVGAKEAYRASQAIAKVFGEEFTEKQPFADMDFPKGQPNSAYAQYFIGNSFLAPLKPVNLTEGESTVLPMSNVTFEPGCRNNWHIHHGARQILICVGGEGWYQEWGTPAIKLKAGDVVDIPEGVKHWHGATKDSWFQHIATHVATGGESSNEWLEPVTDERYAACGK